MYRGTNFGSFKEVHPSIANFELKPSENIHTPTDLSSIEVNVIIASVPEHVIDSGDTHFVKQRPYLTTPENREEIYRQVDNMLQRGIMQESLSPWSSLVVLDKNNSGEMRICIDSRAKTKSWYKTAFH